jgi:hypothetical protein
LNNHFSVVNSSTTKLATTSWDFKKTSRKIFFQVKTKNVHNCLKHSEKWFLAGGGAAKNWCIFDILVVHCGT